MMNWVVLFIAYISLFALGLADNARGALLDVWMREFGLTDMGASMIFFVASATGGTANLVAGYWLPRMGLSRSFLVFAFVFFIGVAMTAMSHSNSQLLWASGIMGVGLSALGICQNLMAMRASHGPNQRQALSGLHLMYGLSSLSAPILVSVVLGSGSAWPVAYWWLTAAALLMFLASAFAFVVRREDFHKTEEASWHHRRSGSQKQSAESAATLALESAIAHEQVHHKGTENYRKLGMWTAALIGSYVMAEILISSRLVVYGIRVWGRSQSEASFLLMIFFALMSTGRLLYSFWQPALSLRWLMTISFSLTLALVLMGEAWGPEYFVLTGVTMAGCFPWAMALISENFGANTQDVTSWTLTFNSLGVVGMNFLFGLVGDHFGLRSAMALSAVFLLFSLVVMQVHRGFYDRNLFLRAR